MLDPLIRGLSKVAHKNDEHPVESGFNVVSLIGEERLRRYFRYDGSLTTPPCYESVIWTLFHEPIPISQEQFGAFLGLHNEHKEALENNFRPIQTLGTRKLYRSFPLEHIEDERRAFREYAERQKSRASVSRKSCGFLVSLIFFISLNL